MSYRSMPCTDDTIETEPSVSSSGAWSARLELRFARRDDTTYTVHRRHHGPLRVQRMLYPEGTRCCHALLLHPPGGIAGGDQLQIDVHLESAAHALLTTPGAAKWYRAGDAAPAQQSLNLVLEEGACLEWLPQESILFEGAQVIQHAEINLAPQSAMFGWDIVQLGRLAAGERWNHGFWQQRLALLRGDHLVWLEQAYLAADDPLRDSPLRLAGNNVFGTAWACSPKLSANHVEALAAARAVAAEFQLPCGITWLAAPAELLVIRALGHNSHTVRELFEALWHTLRPWTSAMPPQRPRIWST